MKKLLILLISILPLKVVSQVGYDLKIKYNIKNGIIDFDEITYKSNNFKLSRKDKSFDPDSELDLQEECFMLGNIIPSALQNLKTGKEDKECGEFIDEIKKFVIQGKLQEAFKIIEKKLGIRCLPNEIILTMAQENKSEREFKCQRINYEHRTIQFTKATALFLEQLDDILWKKEYCKGRCK